MILKTILHSVGGHCAHPKFETLDRFTTILVLVDVLIRVPEFIAHHAGATFLTVIGASVIWLAEGVEL